MYETVQPKFVLKSYFQMNYYLGTIYLFELDKVVRKCVPSIFFYDNKCQLLLCTKNSKLKSFLLAQILQYKIIDVCEKMHFSYLNSC